MRQVEQLELPLWELLQVAATAPDEADLRQLLRALDESLSGLDTVVQLQVAAEAMAQIVGVFQERSTLAFEELEATTNQEGPPMPSDAFDRYVRQTMEVDFEQFIEPLASLPRKALERLASVHEQGSVVGELDQVALLQALDEQMSQHSGLTDVEVFNGVLSLAHDEDVSGWVKIISHWMKEHNVSTIPLVQLQQAVAMPLVQLWLALLLGDYKMEQRGEFYKLEHLWVLAE
ncbi:MAG: hypothetical protein NW220_09835 [Leptolyngbyaceae cyanobacterium bins.349]|nr:hypothetical protein [Leptolyngbyaceae cyanobacterium bins.349]